MSLLGSVDHGTTPHSQCINDLARKTVAGMAHWAGTGPEKKTCRECMFANFDGYYSENGTHRGKLKPIKCQKNINLGGGGQSFDWSVSACRFFEENAQPPTITLRPRVGV